MCLKLFKLDALSYSDLIIFTFSYGEFFIIAVSIFISKVDYVVNYATKSLTASSTF